MEIYVIRIAIETLVAIIPVVTLLLIHTVAKLLHRRLILVTMLHVISFQAKGSNCINK